MTMFKMHPIFTAIVVVFFLALPAVAQDGQHAKDEPLFFKGYHHCDGQRFADNMMLNPVDGYYLGTLSVREFGKTTYQDFNIAISFSKMTSVVASDQEGRPVLIATPNEDLTVLQVQWLDKNRNPLQGCEAFRLVKTENVQTRYRALTALLKTENPRTSIARLVAQGQWSLPPLDFVPETEQEAIDSAYKAVASTFWKRFYANELIRLKELPIDTEKQRIAFVNEVQNAAAIDLTPSGLVSADKTALDNQFAYMAITIAAKRLVAKGMIPQPVYYNTSDPFCRFLDQRNAEQSKGTTDQDSKDDLRLWEIVSGIPASSWTDYTIETYSKIAQTCSNKRIYDNLVAIIPTIQATWDSSGWLRGKTAQYINLPETLESYRNAQWFMVDKIELLTHEISEDDHQRLFIAPLKEKKAVMDKVAEQSFTNYFSTHKNLDDEGIAKACTTMLGEQNALNQSLYIMCSETAEKVIGSTQENQLENALANFGKGPRNLASLAENGWLEPRIILKDTPIPQKLIEDFYAKSAPLRHKAIVDISKEIIDNFATARLDDDNLAIIDTCQALSAVQSTELLALIAACDNGMSTLAARREQAKCDQMVRAMGDGEKLADALFYANKEGLGEGISLRDFACKSGQFVSIKVAINGALWWADTSIDITLKDDMKSHIHADITKAGNGYTFNNIKSSGLYSGISASDILNNAR